MQALPVIDLGLKQLGQSAACPNSLDQAELRFLQSNKSNRASLLNCPLAEDAPAWRSSLTHPPRPHPHLDDPFSLRPSLASLLCIKLWAHVYVCVCIHTHTPLTYSPSPSLSFPSILQNPDHCLAHRYLTYFTIFLPLNGQAPQCMLWLFFIYFSCQLCSLPTVSKEV